MIFQRQQLNQKNTNTRIDKNIIIPKELQKDDLILAKWYFNSIKNKLEKKFNQKGWFTCKKGTNGEYESIHFGKPINFDTWLNLFEKGIVFFDFLGTHSQLYR